MEWAQFGLDVLRVVVWPALIAGLLTALGRNRLRVFFDSLSELSFMGMSAKRTLAEQTSAAADAAEVALDSVVLDGAVETKVMAPTQNADLEPVAVIFDGWSEVTGRLQAYGRSEVFSWNLVELQESGSTGWKIANSIVQLREVRDRVAHGQERVTPQLASEFARGVRYVTAYLEYLTIQRDRAEEAKRRRDLQESPPDES